MKKIEFYVAKEKSATNLFKGGLTIINKLKEYGFDGFFVGGCVRDLILNIQPKDYDIVTNALPTDIEKIFDKTLSIGKQFNIMTVILKDNHFYQEFEKDLQYDVATYRKDGEYLDGRRPSIVEFATMEEDASRRDFTINALYYDPTLNVIFDFFSGYNDIVYGRYIKAIGNPEKRINEDYLRMMRAIRFLVDLNFLISTPLSDAIINNAEKILNISYERIRDELFKILTSKCPKRGLFLLYNYDIIKYILPEIESLSTIDQPKKHHPEGTVWKHILRAFDGYVSLTDPIVCFALLLHDVGKAEAFSFEGNCEVSFIGHEDIGAEISENICRRFKLSLEETERVVWLVKNHMRIKHVQKMRKSKLYKLLRSPYINDLIDISRCDSFSSGHSQDYLDWLIVKQKSIPPEVFNPPPIINGNDIIKLGFKPGKIFGKILNDIEVEQLEGSITNKEEAILFVENKYGLLKENQ